MIWSPHLVHVDSEGHVAVVAVFLKKGNANGLIKLVWKNIAKEKEKAVDVGATVNASDLLPADHGYYTFAGSLTTPPCSEGVTWYVMKTPLALSEAQVTAFAMLYPKNARPISSHKWPGGFGNPISRRRDSPSVPWGHLRV